MICCDWSYLVGTFKYGRVCRARETKNAERNRLRHKAFLNFSFSEIYRHGAEGSGTCGCFGKACRRSEAPFAANGCYNPRRSNLHKIAQTRTKRALKSEQPSPHHALPATDFLTICASVPLCSSHDSCQVTWSCQPSVRVGYHRTGAHRRCSRLRTSTIPGASDGAQTAKSACTPSTSKLDGQKLCRSRISRVVLSVWSCSPFSRCACSACRSSIRRWYRFPPDLEAGGPTDRGTATLSKLNHAGGRKRGMRQEKARRV